MLHSRCDRSLLKSCHTLSLYPGHGCINHCCLSKMSGKKQLINFNPLTGGVGWGCHSCLSSKLESPARLITTYVASYVVRLGYQHSVFLSVLSKSIPLTYCLKNGSWLALILVIVAYYLLHSSIAK